MRIKQFGRNNMTTEVKELFDILMCNYDFPTVFAEGLAEFLIDEEYRLIKYGTWRAETDEEEPNPIFKCAVCSVCGGVSGTTFKYCPNCGAKMTKE
jgi:hypothetical protein